MIKKERYNVILNPMTIKKIDDIAKEQNTSRSNIIDKALLTYIHEFNDSQSYSESELEGQTKIW